MRHFKIDPRSLAVFRIFISICILWDMTVRLSMGRASLAWYTSENESRYPSIQASYDTPHSAKIHQLWFYRGSEEFQILCFLITIFLTICFGLGVYAHEGSIISILLWLSVTAIQNRCTHLNDGSDRFLRCLILWCSFLPMSEVWSIDAYRHEQHALMKSQQYISKKNDDAQGNSDQIQGTLDRSNMESNLQKFTRNSSKTSYCFPRTKDNNSSSVPFSNPINNAASTGLLLQAVLMYLGTVLNRLSGTKWLPPTLEAVHYAISSTFASREWSAKHLRLHPTLTKFMTFQAMVIEGLCPIACLLVPENWRHIPALVLASLHFGLLIFMRLPQWQVLGIICNILWLPPNVWNYLALTRLSSKPLTDQRQHKNQTFDNVYARRRLQISNTVSWCLLCYMLYNFSGEREWIRKHDNGDIGEFIQFSQRWVMYGPDPPVYCIATVMTGKVYVNDMTHVNSPMHIDVLATVRTGKAVFVDIKTLSALLQRPPVAMSAQYPNWRWENAILKWIRHRERRQSSRINIHSRFTLLATFLCRLADDKLTEASSVYSSSLTEITIYIRHLRIMPPGSLERFSLLPRSDYVVSTKCR